MFVCAFKFWIVFLTRSIREGGYPESNVPKNIRGQRSHPDCTLELPEKF